MVTQTLSFTKSAAILNVSQPAITKHIKELERLVGAALFLRHGNSISLTEHGHALVPYAKDILDKYERLNDSVIVDDRQFGGALRLGASTTVAQYIFPAILAKFRRKFPNIEIVLTSGNSEDISKSVIDETIDFAVVEGSDTNQALHYEDFAADEIVLVTASKGRDVVSIEDLTALPLVIRENGSGTLAVVEKALLIHNISRRSMNIVMQLGSSEGIIRYLVNSDSYAFISLAAAHDYLKGNVLRRVIIDELTINRTLRFVSLHGKSGRTAELFKQFCKNS